MFETIVQATKNFCTHQIREPFEEVESFNDAQAIITSIDITTLDDAKHRVYVVSDMPFAQKVSQLFLEEEESDQETLIDMALETTNLIVGSAKVIAQEEDSQAYTIATPEFITVEKFTLEHDSKKIFAINDGHILIAIKAIDG